MRAADGHFGKAIFRELANAFGPVGDDSGAILQRGIDGVNHGAVGPRAGYAKKIAAALGCVHLALRRCVHCGAQRDAAQIARGDEARGCGNIPGNAEFFGENIRGARGKQGHGHGAAGEAVDYFVDCAVAAAGDYQIAILGDGVARDFCGVAAAGGGREFCANAGGIQNARGFFDFGEARLAAAAAGEIIDEQSALDAVEHFFCAPGER